MTGAEYRPDDLAAFRREFDALKRQVNDLQRRAPLRSSSISDEDGNIIVRFNPNGLQFLHPTTGETVAEFSGEKVIFRDDDGNALVRLDDDGIALFNATGQAVTALSADGLSAYDGAGQLLAKLDTDGLFVQRVDGTDIIVMGKFTDGVTDFEGTAIYDKDGRSMLMTRDDKAGLVKPELPVAFRDPLDFTPITSGSFVSVLEWAPRGIYHDTIYVQVGIGSDAGTVGEIRMRETTGGGVTSAVTTTADTFQYATFEWKHGRVPGDDPGAQFATFSIEARRTSGAGNINVYPPFRSVMTSSALIPDADINGNPSID